MRDLAGKRVLVTGGARGIGFALAQRFAAEGAAVIVTDVDESAAQEAAQRLRAGGTAASAYRLDVTDHAEILRVRDAIAADCGPLDVLVNNAGTVAGGPFLDVPLARHLLTYDVNTLGVVAVTHAFLPGLLARPEGHVVIVASASALIGVPYGTTYASSKWGALGFGESLRLELIDQGQDRVGVTTVCPSLVSSGLFDGSKPPRLTRWLTPEQLAATVVRAVRSDRGLVLTPWLVRLTPLFRGVLPPRAFDWMSSALGATRSLAGWTGHAAGSAAAQAHEGLRAGPAGAPGDSRLPAS